MTEKILITGGAGFIGSHLARHLSGEGFEVVVYDNLSSGFRKNIEGIRGVTFIEGDVVDYDALSAAMAGCSRVFHLAALVSVPESMEKPALTVQVNSLGTVNVLNAMAERGASAIVYASSAAVYGESPVCPKTLDMLPEPVSPYAITKLSGEHFLSLYGRERKFRAVSARFFNVFGERQNPESQYAAAVPIFITRAIAGRPITIYGDGEQTRDFIYVGDLVRYLKALSERGQGLYNLGYGAFITINGLLKKIMDITGSKSPVSFAPVRAGDVKHSYADAGRVAAEIGIGLDGFDKGLKNTIDYFAGKSGKN